MRHVTENKGGNQHCTKHGRGYDSNNKFYQSCRIRGKYSDFTSIRFLVGKNTGTKPRRKAAKSKNSDLKFFLDLVLFINLNNNVLCNVHTLLKRLLGLYTV